MKSFSIFRSVKEFWDWKAWETQLYVISCLKWQCMSTAVKPQVLVHCFNCPVKVRGNQIRSTEACQYVSEMAAQLEKADQRTGKVPKRTNQWSLPVTKGSTIKTWHRLAGWSQICVAIWGTQDPPLLVANQALCTSRSHINPGEANCTAEFQAPVSTPQLLCSWVLWTIARLSEEGEKLTAIHKAGHPVWLRTSSAVAFTWTKCFQAQGSAIPPFPKPPCRRKGRSKRNRNYNCDLKRKMEVISTVLSQPTSLSILPWTSGLH